MRDERNRVLGKENPVQRSSTANQMSWVVKVVVTVGVGINTGGGDNVGGSYGGGIKRGGVGRDGEGGSDCDGLCSGGRRVV